MLTLQELWDYYEKGCLHLRIDVFFPPNVDINFPEGLPHKIAEKLIKEKKVTIQGKDGIQTHNFDLDGLNVFAEKGPFYSKIDIRFPADAKFIRPGGLSDDFKKRLIREKRLTIQTGDETKIYAFNLDDANHSILVAVETAHAERRTWEKIKKQMREAGFSYRSESPWSCVYCNGKWGSNW